MPCVTSSFNRTLFRKNLSRFWPLWFGYSLVWLLLLPVYLLTELNYGDRLSFVADNVLSISTVGGVLMPLVFGIFFAMAEFSYLTNPRATQGCHAMPIRREGLFLTGYLSGLFCMLSTLVVCYLLAGLACALFGVLHLRALLLGFAAAALAVVFFYSFGVFCMVFTGQILAAPVFYGVLNVLVVGMEWLVRQFAGNFLFGYYENGDVLLAPLSPVVQLFRKLSPEISYASARGDVTYSDFECGIEGFGWLVGYAVAGLVLAALALYVYKTRKSEATGETVAIPWARPLFKYGVAFCAAFSLGELLYYLLFGINLTAGEYSLPGTLVCMVLAGLLGYFGAEMLLRKSLRVWRTGRVGAAVFTAALLLIGVGMASDLTGYETRVPDADGVKCVSVHISSDGEYTSGTFYDPDTIRLAIAAHRAIAENKERWLDSGTRYTVPQENRSDESDASLRVNYTLESGLTLTRYYRYGRVYARELSDPTSPAAALTALLNADEVVRDDLLFYREDEVTITGGEWRYNNYEEKLGETQDSGVFTAEQAQQIYAAVKRDIALGHAAQRSLFYDYEAEGADKEKIFRLELYGVRVRAQDEALTAATTAVIYGNGTVEEIVYTANDSANAYCSINVTPYLRETLAAVSACTGIHAR